MQFQQEPEYFVHFWQVQNITFIGNVSTFKSIALGYH